MIKWRMTRGILKEIHLEIKINLEKKNVFCFKLILWEREKFSQVRTPFLNHSQLLFLSPTERKIKQSNRI